MEKQYEKNTSETHYRETLQRIITEKHAREA